MNKTLIDLIVVDNERLTDRYVQLRLTAEEPLPAMRAGQFVNLLADGSPSTFLRRPISICHFDASKNELLLLVAAIGDGTRFIAQRKQGDRLSALLPLGNGFTTTLPSGSRPLLVGGGVGVAPLYFLGSELKASGITPTFLLGARSKADVLLLHRFEQLGTVCVTTEDGSLGQQGVVTNHSVLSHPAFDIIYTCGPKPMMQAVARYARNNKIRCEASLENLMACGLGACLCCVEKTTEGHLCVCKEGPVFDTSRLMWNQ